MNSTTILSHCLERHNCKVHARFDCFKYELNTAFNDTFIMAKKSLKIDLMKNAQNPDFSVVKHDTHILDSFE